MSSTVDGRRTTPSLGVVVPALDEAGYLADLLEDLLALVPPDQIVVVDGGSRDETLDIAGRFGVRTATSRPGRAVQMNRGASEFDTDWLLFLHADCRFPTGTTDALRDWIARAPREAAGHFRFRVGAPRWYRGLLEGGQRLRERISGLAYGDQGLVISRWHFHAIGGFRDLPIMEDVEISRRLRKRGALRRIEADLPTSPRRYDRVGPLRGWLRNSLLLTLYLAGVPPRRLARMYPPSGSAPERRDPTSRVLLIFAKVPEPGRVKTRLAVGVGPQRAAEIYREMGREVTDALRRDEQWRTRICFAPDEGGEAMRRWLGGPGSRFRPQGPGDLGARMERAFAEAFREGGPGTRVCLVGTDAPDLDATLVEEAFRRLESGHEVVLGPARDGGYYLVALSAPAPDLFRDMPWSTPRVLGETRARIRSAGWSLAELVELNDVDEVGDLPPALRTKPGR